MFGGKFDTRSSKVLFSLFSSKSLSTLAEKMLADNVIQLCGNDKEVIAIAVKCVTEGKIIALPTDTVYGFAADASNSSALASLYKVKGRDCKKPLAICVKNVMEVNKWGATEYLPKGLLKDLLPGPVTVLLNRKNGLNPDMNPGVNKVGIRVPGTSMYPFIHDVTSALQYPLALTSANLSDEPNSISVEEFRVLWPKLGAVFDNGVNATDKCSREGSTIVDLSEVGTYKITRSGVAYAQTIVTLEKYGLKPLL